MRCYRAVAPQTVDNSRRARGGISLATKTAMITRTLVPFVALALIAGAGMQTSGAAGAPPQAPTSASPPMTVERTKAVMTQYCASCHNDRLRTGGVSFDDVDYGNLPAHAEVM